MLRKLPGKFIQHHSSKLSLRLNTHMSVLKERQISPTLNGRVFDHLKINHNIVKNNQWPFSFVAKKVTFENFETLNPWSIPAECASLELESAVSFRCF
jgi:hypothetical protein